MPVPHRLLAMTLVTACSAAGPAASQAPIATAEVAVCPVPEVPATEVATPAPPLAAKLDPKPKPDRTEQLGPDDILLQLDYESTFRLIDVVDSTKPFGNVPAMTLYRDGTVITSNRHGTRFWGRGERAAEDDLDHVRALGAAKIRNHTSNCTTTGPGEKMCVSDSAIVHVRFRDERGKLRDLANYSGFSDTHRTQLDAIYDRLEVIGTAPDYGGWPAKPWIPANASLFLRFAEDIEPSDREGLAKATPWPLALDIFERAVREEWIVVAIDRRQILALVNDVDLNAAPRVFRQGDRAVKAEIVPWMPGVDHRAAIAATKLG